jgi:hypothetical protein
MYCNPDGETELYLKAAHCTVPTQGNDRNDTPAFCNDTYMQNSMVHTL